MIIKKEFYSEIYFIENPEYLTNNQWDNLLMSGRKNWNQYFTVFKTKRKHEIIQNVELIEFDTDASMFNYIKKVDPLLFLNFSFEHEHPCVLKLV